MEALLTVVDRYGLPLAMLGVLAYVVYKLIWPVLIRQIDESRQQMKEQLKDANDRAEKQTGEFLHALQRRDDILEKGLKEIHAEIHRSNLPAPAKKLRRPTQ